MSTSLVRLVNGGTIQIREGILRGVGPVGPKGDQGDIGPPMTLRGSVETSSQLPTSAVRGDAYLADDTGHLWFWNHDLVPPRWVDAGQWRGERGDLQSPGARFVNAAFTGTVTGASWSTLALGAPDYNDIQDLGTAQTTVVTKANDTEFEINHPVVGTAGQYQVTVELSLTNGAGSTAGWRMLGLYRNGVLYSQSGLYESGNDGTTVFLALTTQVRATTDKDRWSIRVLPNDTFPHTPVRLVWVVSRLGGGMGPQGTQGVQGPKGDQGIQGPQGAPQDGFASYDAVTGGGRDSSTNPGGTGDTTAEQGFPVPGKTQRPHTPYFVRQLATALERYVVARFPTMAAISARASAEEGELVYNEGVAETYARGLYLRHDTGAPTKVPIVRWGTAAPSASTTDPDGTVYLVYVP
jgi:hypothetical protein